MFDWLFNKTPQSSQGMEKLRAQFREMLDASRRAFQLAADGYLRHIDKDAFREELFVLDKSINKSERQIRKELVIHAAIHGNTEFDQCLILMSIVKDAERLGDIAKNIYDLSVVAPEAPDGMYKGKLEMLKNAILGLNDNCRHVFETQDEPMATELICQAAAIEDTCDKNIHWFLADKETPERGDVAYALAFRYFKRYASHVRNIASSIVQPLHKIDFTGKIVRNNPRPDDVTENASIAVEDTSNDSE